MVAELGSILYGMLPQHLQCASNCCPCCMGVAAYACACIAIILVADLIGIYVAAEYLSLRCTYAHRTAHKAV